MPITLPVSKLINNYMLISSHILYPRWNEIRRRCNNHRCRNYHNYGGRGIKNEWKRFEDFKKDMYETYLKHIKEYGEKNTTIERINNNGNYCKNNCKWATYFEQSRNHKRNYNITFNNETKCITDWAKDIKLSQKCIDHRLKNMKWSVEKTLTTPSLKPWLSNKIKNPTN